MIGIAILLLTAAAAHGLARWWKLPAIPLMIVGGLLVNATGFMPERVLLQDTLQLGLAFLVFAAGIELNPRRVGTQRATALRVGLAHFAVLFLIGYVAITGLGSPVQEAIYLGLALSSSSTLLVVRLLQQRKQMFEPFGRLVLGVLLLQDVLLILLLPIVTGIPNGVGEAARGFLGSAVLVIAAFASIRWVAPLLLVRIGLDEEGVLLVTLAFLFFFIGSGIWLGLPMIAGAFLAGVALSGFPVNGIVRGQLTPLSDFFLAVFLTSLGGFITVPEPRDLVIVAVLVGIILLLTPLLVTMIAEWSGLSARTAIESGLLLAQMSEFSLVAALHGWSIGHVREEVLTIVALVTLVTMFLTPFVATNRMTWRLMSLHPMRNRQPAAEPPSGHVLLLGCGDNGMPLLETLLTAGRQVVVVDDDPAVINVLREGDVDCIRGDGSDFDVLQRAGAQNAAMIVSTMRRPRDSVHLLGRVRGIPVLVRVFDQADAEMIERRGGIPISYADAATEDFLEWLDQAESVGLKQERRTRPRHA